MNSKKRDEYVKQITVIEEELHVLKMQLAHEIAQLEKWEPPTGGFGIDAQCRLVYSDSDEGERLAGCIREHKDTAIRDMKEQKKLQRMLAFRAEHATNVGNHLPEFIFGDWKVGLYPYLCAAFNIGLTKATCEKLVAKLNSGEIVL